MLLGEKIRSRRKELGYNADFLAEKTGLSRSTIFRYEKGDIEKIPTEILATIAKALQTNPATLMGWQTDNIVQQITEIAEQLPRHQQEAVLSFAKEQLNVKQEKSDPTPIISLHSEPQTLFEVHGVTEVAAGLGFAFDDLDTYVVYTDQEPPLYDLATMINGDSMEPDFHNGDMLYLREWSSQYFSGQLLVIAIQDRTYFKKVYQDGNQLRLVSLNDQYDDLIIDIDDSSHIKTYQVVGSFTPIEN